MDVSLSGNPDGSGHSSEGVTSISQKANFIDSLTREGDEVIDPTRRLPFRAPVALASPPRTNHTLTKLYPLGIAN